MGWFDGFPFKTKEQLKKEQDAFEKRVFPLGLEQRACALAVLRAVTGPKMQDEERLFSYISGKDKYTAEETPEEGMDALQKQLRQKSRATNEDKRMIIALILLEQNLSSLSEYPTAEQVRLRAQQVELL